jgi:transposase
MTWRQVTDRQWKAIEAHLPKRAANRKGGRPAVSDRKCFEGILWILWTGAPWSELPAQYGSKSTVHRRLKTWAESGLLLDLWRAFLNQLNDRQKVRWDECFIDGMFITAKKGVRWSGRLKEAREQSLWFWPMARVLRSEYTWRRLPRRK